MELLILPLVTFFGALLMMVVSCAEDEVMIFRDLAFDALIMREAALCGSMIDASASPFNFSY